MTRIDSSSLLQMRSMILQQNAALSRAAGVQPATGGAAAPAGAVNPAGRADFTSAMRDALSDVSDMQTKAERASESYERGQTTDIAAVMLSRQQADIGFQATLQVRNKLLAAYKDIMSMPV